MRHQPFYLKTRRLAKRRLLAFSFQFLLGLAAAFAENHSFYFSSSVKKT